jgi:hypothetical protein
MIFFKKKLVLDNIVHKQVAKHWEEIGV